MKQYDRVVILWREAFLFWFLWVTIVTHVSLGEPTDAEPFFAFPDKMMHFVSFGVLAFLFTQTRLVKSVKNCWLLMATWCLFDELTQHAFPNFREFSVQDVLAGELGVASFMVWAGALSRPSTAHIQEKLNVLLARRKTWVSLLYIGTLVTLGGTGLVWYALKVLTAEQYSSLAFFFSFLLATDCVFRVLIRKCEIQVEARLIIKSMLPGILVTIAIAAIVGFATTFTTFDPWVVTMTMLLVGLRIAWNRAT